MLSKIESLGGKITSVSTHEKKRRLDEVEKLTGKLPTDYRDFLLYFGSTVTFSVMVLLKSLEPSPWADKKGYDAIEYLYGLSNTNHGYTLSEVINTYKNDFSMELIPIAFSSGGNQICICIKGKKKGTVWFWDHETNPAFDDDGKVSGLSLVAYDFKGFIDKLVVDDDTSPSKAIGGYLDF